jgi:hypothetical protein
VGGGESGHGDGSGGRRGGVGKGGAGRRQSASWRVRPNSKPWENSLDEPRYRIRKEGGRPKGLGIPASDEAMPLWPRSTSRQRWINLICIYVHYVAWLGSTDIIYTLNVPFCGKLGLGVCSTSPPMTSYRGEIPRTYPSRYIVLEINTYHALLQIARLYGCIESKKKKVMLLGVGRKQIVSTMQMGGQCLIVHFASLLSVRSLPKFEILLFKSFRYSLMMWIMDKCICTHTDLNITI